MQIKINKQNFDLTEAFNQYLNEKFATLDKYEEDILDFQVALKRDQHHRKGEVYSIEVKIILPQKKSIIIKESDSDARRAVDIVQEKIARQLIKNKDKSISKLRRNVKNFKSLKFWGKKDN